MDLPLTDEESRLLRAVLEEYLAGMEEEIIRRARPDQTLAMRKLEDQVRRIGARLQ